MIIQVKGSPGRRALFTVFLLPMLIAVATTGGLIAGLLGDGWMDVASWFGLGLPALASLWWGWLQR